MIVIFTFTFVVDCRRSRQSSYLPRCVPCTTQSLCFPRRIVIKVCSGHLFILDVILLSSKQSSSQICYSLKSAIRKLIIALHAETSVNTHCETVWRFMAAELSRLKVNSCARVCRLEHNYIVRYINIWSTCFGPYGHLQVGYEIRWKIVYNMVHYIHECGVSVSAM